MTEMFRAGDERQHLEDDIRTGDIMYQPLSYDQMKAILQANGMNIVRFRSATHDTDVFDIVNAENSVVKGDCGLMDVEMFIEQRGLRTATSTGPAIGIIVLESTESDVNTELLTIKVKCTSCNEVKPATICAEELGDYTLNEDGETYTSLYGECAECLAGESSDEEESDEDRLERQAQAHLEAAALHRDDPLF